MIIATLLFWICVVGICHTYLLYPVLLKLFTIGRPNNLLVYTEESPELPTISIVMAAYNEEKVISEKIRSIFETSYPASKISLYVGSDNSTDATNRLVTEASVQYPGIHLTAFDHRQGKASIINQLSQIAKGDIIILTDANVFFTPTLLFQLVKHFKSPETGIVGGNIVNTNNTKKSGISLQEKTYLKSENHIKYREGILWGSMMGAFGGCFAIRRKLFEKIPDKFIVDDFFITMAVLNKGYKALNELDAICYEDVSNVIHEEYRRKVRISIGNFQNLAYFRKMLWPPYKGTAFAFLSHKVLRWITPFMLLLTLLSNLFLLNTPFYQFTLITQAVLLLLPLIDFLFKKIGLHIVPLRFVTHFYSMNMALLQGFFKYMKGVQSNVWQPTKRFQQ